MSVSRSDFEVIKPLSEAKNGGCNRGVYLVKSKYSGTKYIEKRVGPSAIRAGYASREVEAMLRCKDHPNIVWIRGYNLDYSLTNYGSIYMQHCELGSLDGVIKRYAAHNARLPDEGFLWKVLWDVSLALCHLFSGVDAQAIRARAYEGKECRALKGWNATMHRDIKPGNIFLTWSPASPDDKCRYPTSVVGDFGCCTSTRDIASGRASGKRNSGGTPAFEPPEAPKFCARSDVYMLGLTIHCLARMSNTPDMKKYHTLSDRFRDGHLRALLRKCVDPDYSRRPTPGELPMLVLKGYREWRKGRRDDGGRLEAWALP
jgi:NIMA (never in mitosis gene a)-related kinase